MGLLLTLVLFQMLTGNVSYVVPKTGLQGMLYECTVYLAPPSSPEDLRCPWLIKVGEKVRLFKLFSRSRIPCNPVLCATDYRFFKICVERNVLFLDEKSYFVEAGR